MLELLVLVSILCFGGSIEAAAADVILADGAEEVSGDQAAAEEVED